MPQPDYEDDLVFPPQENVAHNVTNNYLQHYELPRQSGKSSMELEIIKLREEIEHLKFDNNILKRCQEVDFGSAYTETMDIKLQNISLRRDNTEFKKLLRDCLFYIGFADAVSTSLETRKNIKVLSCRINKALSESEAESNA